MLDKFEKFNRRVCDWCEWLALAALLLMMVITCIDVVGAKVFRWRLLGAIDIVMLLRVYLCHNMLVMTPLSVITQGKLGIKID